MTRTLRPRALNRALLARQFLLQRADATTLHAIEHLGGMQAQVPNAPYVGLWSRVTRFRPDDLAELITGRATVRTALMRATIHLVSARDCLSWRPLLQPVLDRNLFTGDNGRLIAGIDPAELAAVGRALVDECPREARELGKLLRERWPDRAPTPLAYAVRNLVPLVQVPPRGVWGKTGKATYAAAEAWLGRGLDADPSVDDLVLRYLAAFGPATVPDIQTWSGLTRLSEVVWRQGSRLRTFSDEHGRELFDLPDAPMPDPDTPAPTRFLPEFDNAVLAHADRSRIADPATASGYSGSSVRGTVLVDGYVRASWKITKRRGAADLLVEPFSRLSTQESSSVAAEGHRLLEFAADGAAHDVRIG